MNRNVESHFSELPKIELSRSTFDRSSGHKTSFNVGQLIPFYVDEVLPGDTFKVKTSAVVRLQTLLTPIMDNVYMDTYYFYVPNRIVWTHWKEFCGENNSSAWIPNTAYSIPRINLPASTGFAVGTIADYFGIPTGVPGYSGQLTSSLPSALPFRGYAMIVDQYFRDQNVSDPQVINLGDSLTQGSNSTLYTNCEQGGQPYLVAKYHDYFTSALPSPLKGPEIGIFSSAGLPTSGTGLMYSPVVARDSVFTTNDGVTHAHTPGNTTGSYLFAGSESNPIIKGGHTTIPNNNDLVLDNLWSDVTQMNISINSLRLAFQLQKFYEKNARAGTRYRELLKEHFGVTSSDARMQIPEYLGGHRFPLSIHQVANTSQGTNSFLGDLGAMSNTSDVHEDFIKSFEEHGYVIGVCCVRYDHSYPQGLEQFWTRTNKEDFYWPVFANIGEQPVYTQEIYYDQSTTNNAVFGYQEAYASYRYKPSRISGELRPGISNSLASWHLSDYYTSRPYLSHTWIQEDKNNVDRVLAVTSNVSNQVLADFWIENECTRCMPMYSVPGLIDHH